MMNIVQLMNWWTLRGKAHTSSWIRGGTKNTRIWMIQVKDGDTEVSFCYRKYGERVVLDGHIRVITNVRFIDGQCIGIGDSIKRGEYADYTTFNQLKAALK